MRSRYQLSFTVVVDGVVAGKKMDQPLILRVYKHGWYNKQGFSR